MEKFNQKRASQLNLIATAAETKTLLKELREDIKAQSMRIDDSKQSLTDLIASLFENVDTSQNKVQKAILDSTRQDSIANQKLTQTIKDDINKIEDLLLQKRADELTLSCLEQIIKRILDIEKKIRTIFQKLEEITFFQRTVENDLIKLLALKSDDEISENDFEEK